MMISNVYAGYCHFPQHPLADLHGVVRFAVRTTSPFRASSSLEKYGVWLNPRELNKIWGISKSVVEQEVCDVFHFGDVFFCPVVHAYLATGFYKHDRSLMASTREEAQRLAKAEGSRIKAAGPNKRKVPQV